MQTSYPFFVNPSNSACAFAIYKRGLCISTATPAPFSLQHLGSSMLKRQRTKQTLELSGQQVGEVLVRYLEPAVLQTALANPSHGIFWAEQTDVMKQLKNHQHLILALLELNPQGVFNKSTLMEAVAYLDQQYQGKLRPSSLSADDWLRGQAFGIKSMLIRLRKSKFNTTTGERLPQWFQTLRRALRIGGGMIAGQRRILKRRRSEEQEQQQEQLQQLATLYGVTLQQAKALTSHPAHVDLAESVEEEQESEEEIVVLSSDVDDGDDDAVVSGTQPHLHSSQILCRHLFAHFCRATGSTTCRQEKQHHTSYRSDGSSCSGTAPCSTAPKCDEAVVRFGPYKGHMSTPALWDTS